MLVSNNAGISLSLAVWLLHDEYDYDPTENYISVTRLMKPLRQIVLPQRIEASKKFSDVEDYIPRALGKSLHDSIEKAWKTGYKRALALLGYSEDMINRVMINPTGAELKAAKNPIPVYIEQRAKRSIDVDGKTYIIGGKFDMVAEGILHDNKSTSAWSWVLSDKDEDHVLQMSKYRWIDAAQPIQKVTADFCRINYIFTDWQKFQAKQNAKYPQKRVETKQLPLLSLAETEAWIRRKVKLYIKYKDTPENLLPECSDEELWRSDTKYKYYADPTKTSGKSTRNFDSSSDAKKFMINERGGKGIVLEVPGEPKRCMYCEAFDVCTQKDRYFSND
jgi:hypothetical protein